MVLELLADNDYYGVILQLNIFSSPVQYRPKEKVMWTYNMHLFYFILFLTTSLNSTMLG
jgi:hypothetical protein